MNRVSAQNARDRRRVYVEELEKKIALLEDKVAMGLPWLFRHSMFADLNL